MALLKFQDETGAEQFVHVGPDRPEITIGRVRTCDLVTTNITVSRRHASVTFEDGKFILRDKTAPTAYFTTSSALANWCSRTAIRCLSAACRFFSSLSQAT